MYLVNALLEAARALNDPGGDPGDIIVNREYVRGQADLIGELTGFGMNEFKDDIMDVICHQKTIGEFWADFFRDLA